jgi:outer membrane protein TolC
MLGSVARLLGFSVAIAALGCRSIAPAPLEPDHVAARLDARALDSADLRGWLRTLGIDGSTWPPERWGVDSFTTVALFYHPILSQARARRAQVDATTVTARQLPNPTLSVTPEFVSNAASAVSPWITAIRLDWIIETAGKRERRVDRARAAVVAAALGYRQEVWSVRQQIWANLVAAISSRRRVDQLREEVDVASGLVASLELRKTSGTAAESDVAPFRAAMLGSQRDLAAELGTRNLSISTLAEAIGVPPHALRDVRLEVPDERWLESTSRDAALSQALFARADVLAAIADYAAAEAGLRLELARQYPDIRLGPGYQYDQGQRKWSIGLSLDLPILNQNQGAIAESLAARAAAAAAFESTQSRAMTEVDRALRQRDASTTQMATLAAIAGERAANWQRVRAALEIGAADRVAERSAALEFLRAERARHDAEDGRLQSLGALEAAIQPASARIPWTAATLGAR